MINFDELERQFNSQIVNLKIRGQKGSGVLSLAGDATRLSITHKRDFRAAADKDGFYSFSVTLPNGSSVYLHKAVMSGWSDYSDKREAHISPNYVIVNSEHLYRNRISVIRFKLNGLRNFFPFRFFENFHMRTEPAIETALQDAIKRISAENKFPFSPVRFLPLTMSGIDSVYAIPKPAILIDFMAKGSHYTIESARTGSDGNFEITQILDPIVTIRFKASKSIDAALNAVWTIRHFFEQIGMSGIGVSAIEAAKTMEDFNVAELYSPLMTRDTTSVKGHESPVRSWNDLGEFTALMQQWVEHEEPRFLFRSHLSTVLNEFKRTLDADHLLKLCAAVEGLPELASKPDFSSEQVGQFAEAVAVSAKATGTVVNEARVRDLLALLNKTSLGQRLKALTKAVSPAVPKSLAKVILDQARTIRNTLAHGNEPLDPLLPNLRPTIHGLLALCVIYDLETSKPSSPPSRLQFPAAARYVYKAHLALDEVKRAKPKRGAQKGQEADLTRMTKHTPKRKDL